MHVSTVLNVVKKVLWCPAFVPSASRRKGMMLILMLMLTTQLLRLANMISQGVVLRLIQGKRTEDITQNAHFQ